MSESPDPNEQAYAHASPFQPKQQPPLLERAVPVSQELPAYRGGHARRDVLAGVTVAALALPSAMAYAELAGLSPVNGLYALLLPTGRAWRKLLVARALLDPSGLCRLDVSCRPALASLLIPPSRVSTVLYPKWG